MDDGHDLLRVGVARLIRRALFTSPLAPRLGRRILVRYLRHDRRSRPAQSRKRRQKDQKTTIQVALRLSTLRRPRPLTPRPEKKDVGSLFWGGSVLFMRARQQTMLLLIRAFFLLLV